MESDPARVAAQPISQSDQWLLTAIARVEMGAGIPLTITQGKAMLTLKAADIE